MLPMRKNEFLSGVSVPEVSSQEVWNIDKVLVCRRVVAPEFLEQFPDMTGGRWLREAALSIATDMLANKVVKVEKRFDLEREVYQIAYVAKLGTPDNYRILP